MRRTILSRPYLLASGAFLLAATAALAGSGVGGVFNLGQTNSVNGTTRLQGATSSQQLYVQNASATADSIGIIGVSTAGTGVWGHTNSRVGVRASAGATTGVNYGVFATTGSPSGFAGYFQNSAPTNSNGTAVVAVSKGKLSDIPNRYAKPAGAFLGYNGVLGVTSPDSADGFAVIGHTSAPSGAAVRAASTSATGANYGIWASAASKDGQAGFFSNQSGTAIKALGSGAAGNEFGDYLGPAGGQFVGPIGVLAAPSAAGGVAVLAVQGKGLFALFAQGDSNLLGNVRVGGTIGGSQLSLSGDATIDGNLRVKGSVSKGSGTFQIDHPLDPENKYLSHSFVESPDMMNIYNGNVVTDAHGEAIVELPGYFEALNRDPRYQLTVIGTMAQAIVDKKIAGNRFSIRTSEPNVEVSWQVTGIRQDGFAKAHPVIVEEEKSGADRGRYLHPTELGMPASLGIDRDPQVASAVPAAALPGEQ